MLAKCIIPCLDVKDGRVVKGVNFVGLRDAGDPVEQRRATTAGRGRDCLPRYHRQPGEPGPILEWCRGRRRRSSCR